MKKNGKSSPLLLKYLAEYEKNPRGRVFAPLAECYRSLDMHDRAFDVLKKGIKFHPEYILGYLVLSECYFDKGDFALCYATLRPFVTGHRDNLRMQRIFAQACEHLKNYEEALDSWKFLLFINPKDNHSAQKVAQIEKLLDQKLEQHNAIKNRDQKNGAAIENIADYFEISSFESLEPEVTPKATLVDQLDNWQTVNLQEPPVVQANPIYDDLHPKGGEIVQQDNQQENDSLQEYVDEGSDVGDSPLVTHTLVDLYCQQGYFEKAKEILRKILELNPEDSRTQARLEKILQDYPDREKVELAPIVTIIDQKEDEGRADLMNLFDSKVKNGQEIKRQVYEDRLWMFLDKIKERAKSSKQL